MINSNDVGVAESVMCGLDALGKFNIDVKSGSHLEKLRNLTPIEIEIATRNTANDDSIVDIATSSSLPAITSRSNLSGVYEHDVALESIVDLGWSVISQRIRVTRDRAIPMVSGIITSLNNIYNLSFTNPPVYSIIEKDIPEVVYDSLVTSIIDRYATTDYNRISNTGNNVVVSITSMDEFRNLPEELVQVFDANYRSKLPSLFDDNFSLVELLQMVITSPFDTDPSYENITWQLRHLCVIDLLLTTGVLPNGISGYSTNIDSYLRGEAARFAKQIDATDKYSQSRLENKVLIANLDIFGLKIYVNGSVYRAWLGVGGTAEALIGYAYSGDKVETPYDAILEDLTRYTELYHISKLRASQEIEANQTLEFKRNLPFQFSAALSADGFTSEQIDAILPEARKKFNAIDSVNGEWVYMAILRIVDELVFPENYVYEIAKSFNRISAAIPGISTAEVEMLVVTEMLVEWMADQVIVTTE